MEALSDIFPIVLDRVLTTAVLILAVMILRLVLRRAPKWSVCLLWAVVGAALVLPRWLPSPASAYGGAEPLVTVSAPQQKMETQGQQLELMVAIPASLPHGGRDAGESGGNGAAEVRHPEVREIHIPLEAAAIVWLVGAVSVAVYGGASYIKLRRRVRVSAPDGEAYVCDGIDTPFILGIFRPKIYLPPGISPEERFCVMAHEKAHLRRLDHVWKPLGFLILAVYWFDLLCWGGLYSVLQGHRGRLRRACNTENGSGGTAGVFQDTPGSLRRQKNFGLSAGFWGDGHKGQNKGCAELQEAGLLDNGGGCSGMLRYCCVFPYCANGH